MALSDAQKIAAGVAAILLALAGVTQLVTVQHATPVVARWEGGRRPDGSAVAYADRLAHGLPTACEGITGHDHLGRPIVVGRHYTREECDLMLQDALRSRAVRVLGCIPPVPTNTGVAALSLAFNIGEDRFCRSRIAVAFRAHQFERACELFGHGWDTSAGVYRVGLHNRRMDEQRLCRSGILTTLAQERPQ